MTLRNAFEDLATESASDTIIHLLQQLVAMQPTKSNTGAMRIISGDGTSLVGQTAYATAPSNINSNPAQGVSFFRLPEQWQFSNAGSAYLYNQITVS